MFKPLSTAATVTLLSVSSGFAAEVKGEEYQVIDSNVASYVVGDVITKLPKKDTLPSGGYVRFLSGSYETILVQKPTEPRKVGGVRDAVPDPLQK